MRSSNLPPTLRPGAAVARPPLARPHRPLTRRLATPSYGDAVPPPPPPSLADRLKRVFGGEGDTKARLQKLGTGAVASYGFISNVTYGGGMAFTWVAFVKQYGLSPLAPGGWTRYLAFYSAFWVTQNFIRPLRFSAAIALAPAFDRFIDGIAARLNLTRPKAFGVYLALLGTATSALVFGGIFVACGPAAFAR